MLGPFAESATFPRQSHRQGCALRESPKWCVGCEESRLTQGAGRPDAVPDSPWDPAEISAGKMQGRVIGMDSGLGEMWV